MLRRAAIVLAALLPAQALAQTLPDKQPASNVEAAQKLTEALQSKLADQGFTEVQIIPGSFVVTARNKEGVPVAMVIGPHSTMVLVNPEQGPDQAQTPEPSGGDQFKWH